MAVAYEQRRFSVDDYYAMGAAGVFGPDERVELVDGEIVAMPPIIPRHGGMVMRITETLMMRFSGRTIIGVQGPARISRFSEPQPDLALLRPRSDYYSNAHPAPADILAIIEVAESSLR